MRNRQQGITGVIVILGLMLGFGIWQRHSQAAGKIRQEIQQFAFSAAVTRLASSTLPPATVAPMATFTVQSLADGAANPDNCPGVNCRLRDAIAKAAAGDTIDFSVTGTITLTSGELSVGKNLTINGPGAKLLTISGNNASRVFSISQTVTAAISGLTIANGNSNPSSGGGISNAGVLTVTDCAISGNSAPGGDGGGIFSFGNSGTATLTIRNSTISGNTAQSWGGGIRIINSGATLVNTTLSGNSARYGGGMATPENSVNAFVFVRNCTITGNSAAEQGGGIYRISSAVVYADLQNTLIAGNNALTGPDFSGLLVSSGYNLIGNTSGVTIGNNPIGNLLNVNPMLGPLADNGGQTRTHALLPGSPAIDSATAPVDPVTSQPVTTDQRGLTRTRDLAASNGFGNGTDIGAFELQNEATPLTINPGSLAGGTVGNAYSQTLSAAGGSGNYQFGLLNSSLPFGLTLSPAGQITGTPTSGGNFAFTVLVADVNAVDTYGLRTYTIAITPGPCATAPPGLMAWWKAAGDANDAVLGNHGTLNGSATISTAAEGHVGQAFKFDGTNGYVALPDNLFPFPNSGGGTIPFSFELWFKSVGIGVILGQQTAAPYGALGGFVPAIYVGTDGKLRVQLFENGAKNPLVSANPVNDNGTYHHVVVTYEGAQQTVYLDGQVMGSRVHTQTGYSASYKYQLGTGGANGWPAGTSANGGWFNFTGLIDEPSLYNAALTAQQVQALFAAGSAGKCAPPCLVVTNPAVSSGTEGFPFDQTFTQTRGVAPVSFSLASGTLPAGLTLASDGRLSGTPTQGGFFPITVSATDSAGCTQAGGNYALTICNKLVVTSNADSGAGSLREAISLSCASGSGLITFAPGISQIALTSGPLVINKNLTINGPGASLLTISGSNASRVVTILSGATVSINGLTIANGSFAGIPANGGGLGNSGILSLTGCTFSGNWAEYGGGGLANFQPGVLTLRNCTFTGNTTAGRFGGAVRNVGQMNIYGTTFSGNSSGVGGALINDGAMTISNSTISGNPSGQGGGIYNYGTLTINRSTITANSGTGGGINVSSGTVSVRNTIIAGNTGTNPDVQGSLNSMGYNVIGNTSGATITGVTTGNLLNVNPLLGPLASNGGPTQTHLLLAGSPAIDAGASATDPVTGQLLTTDQRGLPRLRDLSAANAAGGDGSDIGAIELQNDTIPLAINPATLPDGVAGTPYNQTLRATGGSGNYSFALASGALPSGLTLSSSGQLSGTPTIGTHATFTLQANDNNVLDVYSQRTYTVTIFPAGCASAPSGLVAWWRAEGNATDAVGTNHGTLNGSATISTAAEGYVGQAFKFDGTNGYVALPDNLFPFPNSGTGTTPFSLELWFKSATSGGVILGQQGGAPYGTVTGWVPAIYVGTDGKLRVQLFGNNVNNPLVSANPVNDNSTYHHVAVTYDGAQQTVYLDGQVMGSRAHTQIGYNASYKYQLGTGNTNFWPAGNGGWFNFTGLIDEPSLYNRALTAQEVQSLLAAAFVGKCLVCSPLTVNPSTPTLAGGRAGDPYSQSFTQAGGSGLTLWSVSGGALPAGLSLNLTTGQLEGTPTAFGNFSFTVRATSLSSSNCFGERSYSLTILPPCGTITVNPASLANGFQGTAYSQTLTATGGTAPYSFAVTSGNLPGGLSLAGSGELTGVPSTPGSFSFSVTATDSTGCTGTRSYSMIVSGNGLQFYPLPQPVRLLETRAGANLEGCTRPNAPINTNGTLTLPARTTCAGIPADAQAVTGNITVVPSGGGFLTLFPSSAAQPTVANSNFGPGEVTNNVFTVGLGAADGAFKIFASGTTHVIVDVTGYYAPPGTGGLYFHPLATPVRLLETRAGLNGCIAPGAQLIGTGDPNADPNLDLSVQGRSPVASPCNSIPASAQVLVGNATSVVPDNGGYLTIYPSGGTRPLIASSNYVGSDVINGPFSVKLGADGKFKIYTLRTTHLVVDILGYYSEEAVDANGVGLLFSPLPVPVRLLETRPGGPPLVGCTRTNAPIQGNLNAATHTQQAAGFCGLPASAQAVVGNVSVVSTPGAGFLTLFPGNLTNAPLVATSNYPSPAASGYNRHYFVGLSPTNGTFKVLTQFTTELILDASGYFAP